MRNTGEIHEKYRRNTGEIQACQTAGVAFSVSIKADSESEQKKEKKALFFGNNNDGDDDENVDYVDGDGV